MVKEYLFEIYILFFEKIFNSDNKATINKYWQKIKNNTSLLEYATSIHKDEFRSKIIVYMILEDETLYNTEIYNKLVNRLYLDYDLARKKVNNSASFTFLMQTFKNEELILTESQKAFLINEGEKCPYTEKYYRENNHHLVSIHGTGIFDIRFKILRNKNFTLEEKIRLFHLFYPDNEVGFIILNELKWEAARELGIHDYEKDFDTIYSFTKEDIESIIKDNEKQQSIIEIISLCKVIRDTIPENEIKNFKNNN